jgi:protein-disulfide isomerase
MKKIKENLLPLSILVAGLLIAGAIIFTRVKVEKPQAQRPSSEEINYDALRPVTDDDWIRGDINAPVKVIEFSDFECPFCKMFHQTMIEIMKEYKGKVAWIYRHFPLDVLHKKARKEAEAAECVGYLGGDSAFWLFADKIFEVTPSNDGLDHNLLPDLAFQAGVDKENFKRCLNEGRYAKNVEEDANEALKMGIRGTPTSIVIAPNGKKFLIQGARPYSQVKDVIEEALRNQ